ncbi:hypothetical protein [Domibacillus iocasae]|uniref:Uncharacterized protein n=1 Tax=Domibacillus iocasae TaxID=1714016 RepID=A0A1E7DPG6_9BACI|nr:hypothetical protein [Domibacillus iocasae]OES44953.1 hypothetical protein BA724_06735 [Domibacillus iocasae]
MDKLEKRLRAGLLENAAVEIRHAAVWQLPVIGYDATFKRVKRLKMDILMKMLLLTFQQADIRRAASLSEMLLVEELFVADLIQKMQRTGLIRLEKEGYRLTAKGYEHLKRGIFEEEMKEEETELFYSPAHDAFWTEKVRGTEKERPLYRYARDRSADADQMLRALAEREEGVLRDGFQTVVAEITNFNEQLTEHVLCLEFQLYNKEQDLFYARVWNTALNRWDETLEQQIEEQERLEWRVEAEKLLSD